MDHFSHLELWAMMSWTIGCQTLVLNYRGAMKEYRAEKGKWGQIRHLKKKKNLMLIKSAQQRKAETEHSSSSWLHFGLFQKSKQIGAWIFDWDGMQMLLLICITLISQRQIRHSYRSEPTYKSFIKQAELLGKRDLCTERWIEILRFACLFLCGWFLGFQERHHSKRRDHSCHTGWLIMMEKIGVWWRTNDCWA